VSKPNPSVVLDSYKGRGMAESGHQVALFHWAWMARTTRPELRWLHSVPNGGLRNKAVAAQMVAEGCMKGVPDIFLDVPRGGYHGLRIELKVPEVKAIPGVAPRKRPGSTSPEQKEWLEHYQANGYFARVCHGWENAMQTIIHYLDLKNP